MRNEQKFDWVTKYEKIIGKINYINVGKKLGIFNTYSEKEIKYYGLYRAYGAQLTMLVFLFVVFTAGITYMVVSFSIVKRVLTSDYAPLMIGMICVVDIVIILLFIWMYINRKLMRKIKEDLCPKFLEISKITDRKKITRALDDLDQQCEYFWRFKPLWALELNWNVHKNYITTKEWKESDVVKTYGKPIQRYCLKKLWWAGSKKWVEYIDQEILQLKQAKKLSEVDIGRLEAWFFQMRKLSWVPRRSMPSGIGFLTSSLL